MRVRLADPPGVGRGGLWLLRPWCARFVKSLRRKLGEKGSPIYIMTERGVGYGGTGDPGNSLRHCHETDDSLRLADVGRIV